MVELQRLFEEIDRYFDMADEDGKKPEVWQGHHKFTIRKAQNRFKNLTNKYGGLLAQGSVNYGNLPLYDSAFSDQEVRVIDIAKCNTNVQELLVNRLINAVWDMAERQELGVDKVIIFVDELNKYAAAGSQGGLRDTLVDIAARGRHLNVVLFGAQQFRSKVDDEILGNCGTSFYGRVGDEEIINSSYRSLSDTAKAELLGLRKGQVAGPPRPLPNAALRLLPEATDDQGHGRAGGFQRCRSGRRRRWAPRRRALLPDPPVDDPGLSQSKRSADRNRRLSGGRVAVRLPEGRAGIRAQQGQNGRPDLAVGHRQERADQREASQAPHLMTKLRFAHISDTHLGYRSHFKTDPATGRNQRSVDVEEAYRIAIDDILTRDVQLVIHGGDVFHHTRPTWTALSTFLLQTQRLVNAGLPVLVIGGNHDTPRLRTSGSVFSFLRHALPGVHFVCAYEQEAVHYAELGLVVHAGAAWQADRPDRPNRLSRRQE